MATAFSVLAVLAVTYVAARPSQPGPTDKQFAIWTGDLPRDWRGVWMRFDPSGAVLNEMRASRAQIAFEGGRAIRQTDVYGRRDFFNRSRDDLVFRQETLGSVYQVAFGKGGNWFVTSSVPSPSALFFEIFVKHPTDDSVRFSLVPVFREGKFIFIAFVRDVDVLRKPAGHFWKFGRGAATVMKSPPLGRRIDTFRGTLSSISADFKTSENAINWRWWSLERFLEIDNSKSVLRLPDGISFWFPADILSSSNKRRMVFSVVWNVNGRTTIARKAVYRNGMFSRTHTATLFH